MATGAAELPRLPLRRLGGDQEGSPVFPRPQSGGGGGGEGAGGRHAVWDPRGFGVLERGPEERERKGMLGKGGLQGRGRT